MNMLRVSTRLALGICLIQVLSCQKQIEKETQGSLEFSTASEAVLVSEFADCKLRTVSHEFEMPPGTPNVEIKGTFVYHPDGRPAQLTYSQSLGHSPNYYFKYDSKLRLKELLISHSPTEGGDMSLLHKYGYNANDQIIADSLFNFLGFELSSAILRGVSAITYDAQGRVKTETPNGGATVTYNYDTKGNLIVDGWPSSSYDNNVSIYRMHPLFQFIHRNYSKNNATAQPKYNVKGLSLANSPSNDDFFSAYATSRGGTGVTKATYDCDGYVPANEFLYCKLRTVTHESISPPGQPNVEIKGTFIYHPDGLPAELTYQNSILPNYYFVYDNKRRLRELQETYSRNAAGPVVWHRYGYNNFNQIIVDTLFNFTSFDPASAHPRLIATLTYDAQGRVKTEVRTPYAAGDLGGVQTINYNYDSRGNLIVAGWPSSSYDNKVSIFRAHSLFQFIHRNYSKNNAAPQAKYNSKGLPLSNKPMNHRFFNAYPNVPGETAITKINYDCP